MLKEHLREYLIERFFKANYTTRFPNILEYEEENEKFYEQLHAAIQKQEDMLIICAESGAQPQKLLILLENYLLCAYIEVYEAPFPYEESLDILTVFFSLFLNAEVVEHKKNFFVFDETTQKQFYGDPSQFYYGFETLMNITISYLVRLKAIIEKAQDYHGLVKQQLASLDQELFTLVRDIPLPDVWWSHGLHYCWSIDLIYELTDFVALADTQELVAFDTLLLSNAVRAFAPDLLPSNSTKLYSAKITTCIEKDEQVRDALDNALAAVLGTEGNQDGIEYIVERAYKLAYKNSVKKAFKICSSFVAAAFGGGIALVGAIILIGQ